MCVKILSAVRQVINFISNIDKRREAHYQLGVWERACVNRHDATHAEIGFVRKWGESNIIHYVAEKIGNTAHLCFE